MKALLSEAPGGPETLVLRDVPEPLPGPGEVRIRVAACAINYPDVLIIEDRYQFKPPRPFAPGGEVAGVVDAVGEGVSIAVGARVLAVTGWGGLAEAIVCPAARALPIPDAMAFETAAAFLLTYGTSWHALMNRAEVRAGETLLVLGAGGGVGLAAVELGVTAGARVIAAVSSEAKARAAREHGADAAIVYPREPEPRALAAQFKAACGPGARTRCTTPWGACGPRRGCARSHGGGGCSSSGSRVGFRHPRSTSRCSRKQTSWACSGARGPSAIRRAMRRRSNGCSRYGARASCGPRCLGYCPWPGAARRSRCWRDAQRWARWWFEWAIEKHLPDSLTSFRQPRPLRCGN